MELLHQNLDSGETRELSGLVTACTVKTVRRGAPGQMDLTLLRDGSFTLAHGDILALKDGDRKIFYGYLFKLGGSEKEEITVTAYDQLRYLKNKDTYVFEGQRADQIAAQIAADFELKTGEMDNTGYVIPSMTMDGKTLFDIILEALDRTLINTGKMYVLWDDYGALRLSDVEGGRSILAVGDGSLATGYTWESSIDSDTANQVKLVQDNKSTGKRDVYIVKDSVRMRRWGVLQHYEKAGKGLNAGQLKAQAQQMLELYNRPSVKLELSALEGDLDLRAGRSIYVDIADRGLKGWYIIDECTHDIIKETVKMTLLMAGC